MKKEKEKEDQAITFQQFVSSMIKFDSNLTMREIIDEWKRFKEEKKQRNET